MRKRADYFSSYDDSMMKMLKYKIVAYFAVSKLQADIIKTKSKINASTS
jgi:hypothetical protein